MKEPVWLSAEALKILNSNLVSAYGGAAALVRDENLLMSAIHRAQNIYAYQGVQAIPSLAAIYAFSIAQGHVFIDGNKRTAVMALELFLELNNMRWTASDDETIGAIRNVASGAWSEEIFHAFVRDNVSER